MTDNPRIQYASAPGQRQRGTTQWDEILNVYDDPNDKSLTGETCAVGSLVSNPRIYMRAYRISLTSNAAGIMSLVCNNHVRG